MPSFWYTVAIATASSALLGLVAGIHLNVPFVRSSAPVRTTLPIESPVDSPVDPPVDLPTEQPVEPEPFPATEVKKDAAEDYRQALVLANQAVAAYQRAKQAMQVGDSRRSLALTRQEQVLWRQTLQQLRTIPQPSPQYEPALAKRAQYRQLLATAESKISRTEGDFLTGIMREAGVNPQGVHVSLCQIDIQHPETQHQKTQHPETQHPETQHQKTQRQIDHQMGGQFDSGHCRHHQGDERMASPASLIKVPIAIALLRKVATEKIDLNHAIYIDPGNFTENAAGSKIEVDQIYPLRQVMAHMIDQSNNVATNQLIDYIGRDEIDRILLDMGYTDTYAGHKLVGDVIFPTDSGDLGNQSTTHDITAMMVDIYRLQTPEYAELLTALHHQSDQEFGYTALQEMTGAIAWIGEKTGQNDRVIATTLAVKIGEERYALTVALNHSGETYAMREIIQGVVSHVLATGPLVDPPER